MVVSYLPLSHVAAQMADLFGVVRQWGGGGGGGPCSQLNVGSDPPPAPFAMRQALVGGCCSFAQPDALKGSLVETLVEVCSAVLQAMMMIAA